MNTVILTNENIHLLIQWSGSIKALWPNCNNSFQNLLDSDKKKIKNQNSVHNLVNEKKKVTVQWMHAKQTTKRSKFI